jgi:hypothetical protein
MKKYSKVIGYNHYLNQYIKDAIAATPSEKLLNLDAYSRELIETKKIYTRGSFELKLWLLGQLGYRYAIFLGPRKNILNENLFSLPNITKALKIFKKKIEMLRDVKNLSKLGIFVMADAEVIHGLTLLSTVYNSQLNSLTRDYEKIVEKADKASAALLDKDVDKTRHSILQTDRLISSAADCGNKTHPNHHAFKQMFDITMRDYKILSYLSYKRELVESSELIDFVKSINSEQSKLVVNLIKLKYVVVHTIDYKRYYTLTGMGESTLRMARNYIIKQALE